MLITPKCIPLVQSSLFNSRFIRPISYLTFLLWCLHLVSTCPKLNCNKSPPRLAHPLSPRLSFSFQLMAIPGFQLFELLEISFTSVFLSYSPSCCLHFQIPRIRPFLIISLTSPVAWMLKNLPAALVDMDLITGSERSSGEGKGYPLQYSCLENCMDRRVWRATVPGVVESFRHDWMTHTHTHTHTPATALVKHQLLLELCS